MTRHFTLKNIIKAVAASFAFIAFILMFFNQVDVIGSGKMNFVDSFFGRYGSPLSFVGYILIILSSLTIGGMIMLNVLEEKKRVVYFIVAGVLVVSSILIFIEGAIITNNINTSGVKAQLLFPPVFAGILAFLAAIGICFSEFINDKQLG